MGKLVKLINNPKSFIRNTIYDAVKPAETKKVATKPAPAKKTTTKEPAPVKKPAPAKKPAPKKNIDISHINFYEKFTIILHSGETLAAGSNHLIPWIPIFLKSQVKFLILLRHEPLFEWAKKEYPWLSVAFARRGVDVEEVLNLFPDARTIFYPSSTGNNIHVVRFNHIKHVFIGHGDSDKASSAHKALRLYDEVWTAGQGHIDRFKNSDFDTAHIKFAKVGRPNLSNILNSCQTAWQHRMDIRVLYLPTWEGVVEETNYSSTSLSGQIIREVQKKLQSPVMIKYHPFTGNRNSNLKNINEMTREVINNENLNASVLESTVDISTVIPNNNIFICDISGVVTECLAADAPIFVYIPKNKDIKIASSDISYEEYCYTYSNVEELLEKLHQVVSGDDYLMESRKKAIDYFIGYEQTLGEEFVKRLQMASKHIESE